MADTEGDTTPRNSATDPPFASSTTRSSLAWRLDGSTVNFTRQTAEATVSEPAGSEGSTYYSDIHSAHSAHSHPTSTSMGHTLHEANAPGLSDNITLAPSGLSTPNGGKTRSTTLVERDLQAKHVDIDPAVEACPVLANEILMKANPRGPRQQKWATRLKRQLWWFIPLNIVFGVSFTVYFIYQDRIAAATDGVRVWLGERIIWSWSIPTAFLILLSCPPFFLIPLLSEVIQFLVGLTFPLWIAVGIASVSTVLGDGVLFLIFKYFASGWVYRRCEERSNWAAIARVSQESGIWGVLLIRYSVVPPSLANPIFATTGMSLWLYMLSLILSLPKQIVFVILGYPANKDNKAAVAAKAIAVSALIIVTILGTLWLRRQLRLAKDAIRAERNVELSAEIRKQVKALGKEDGGHSA